MSYLIHHIPVLVSAVALPAALIINRRMHARKPPASLRDLIRRNRHDRSLAAALQIAYITLWLGLRLAGLLSSSGYLSGTIASGFFLAIDIRRALQCARALRTYDANPAAAYIAEIKYAFGVYGNPAPSPGQEK